MKPIILAALVTLAAAPATAQPIEPEAGAEADVATIYNYVRVTDALATAGQPAYDHLGSIRGAGFDVVVNLAPAIESANALEGYLATEEGMSYVQIPVNFREPPLRDLELFFDVMEANRDRRVFVHCSANMRASAFTYLYRTLIEGVPEAEALEAMSPIWDPNESPGWKALIEEAKAKYAR